MLELNRIYQGDCFIYLKNNIYVIIWGRKKDTNKRKPTNPAYRKVSKPGHILSAKFAENCFGENNMPLKKENAGFVQRRAILYGNVGKRKPSVPNLIDATAKTQIGGAEFAQLTQKSGEVKNLKNGGNRFLNAITGPVRNAAQDVKKSITSESRHIILNPLQYFQNCASTSTMESRYVKNVILSNQKGGTFIV